MPKVGELNWDNLMKGAIGEPEHPLSQPVKCGPVLEKGKKYVAPPDAEIRAAILNNSPAQPSDEELFGHLVPTEEQVQKADKNWDNRFNDHFALLNKPVDDQNSDLVKNWGSGKSFNDGLTPEELAQRNAYVGDGTE